MRLWSLHPKYLDSIGLIALWREGLLAQNVLAGKTKGYRHHPQLERFKASSNSMGAIAAYLKAVAHEADNRGYKFNHEKINSRRLKQKIQVTTGQIEFEYRHLLNKLKIRDKEKYLEFKSVGNVETHPLFCVVEGDIESWEMGTANIE